MKITKELLVSMNACEEQVLLFEKVFPKGAYLNTKNVKLAAKSGLDLVWLFTNARLSEYSKRLRKRKVIMTNEKALKLSNALLEEAEEALDYLKGGTVSSHYYKDVEVRLAIAVHLQRLVELREFREHRMSRKPRLKLVKEDNEK